MVQTRLRAKRVLLPRWSLHVYQANYPKSLHLLLKNFSSWNSLSDVLSAPLFGAAVSIHLCCLRHWISSRRSRSRGFFGVKSSPARIDNSAFLCLLFCLHEKWLRFTDRRHCFADDEKTALHECFVHWWEFEIAFSRMLRRNKNALWRQTTVWRLFDVMADTIGYICCGSILSLV